MSVEHKAQALAISCIDFRFQEAIQDDLQRRNLNGNCDRIGWPGASKDFEAVDEKAKISLVLHDPDHILIYEHEDCGAYGEDNSEDTHRRNANRLKNSLQNSKPELKIETLIATFRGIKDL